jgi:hemolysin D
MFRRLQEWLKRVLVTAPQYQRGLVATATTPPAPLSRAVLWCLLALFGLLLLWAIFGRLDVIATAEGKLVPRTFLKIVQPAEAGVVAELLVAEGESVREGQVLMRMDTRLSEADSKALKGELALRKLQLRRIDSELSGRPFLRDKDDPVDLFLKVAEQHRAYRQAYGDSVAQEEAGLRKVRQEFSSAIQVRDKLKRNLVYYNKQSETFGKLGQNGFVSTLFVEDKERERAEKEQDYKAQEYTLSSLEANVQQSEHRVAQIKSNYQQQLQTERIQALSQAERLTQEVEKQQRKHELLELKAPQAGIVKDIASHTKGTVVTPGTILLTLVPQGEPLIAEVQVKNQDSGFIYSGQKAKVKIASYPFQKYGMVQGTIAHFSADASDTAGGRPEEVSAESRIAVTSHYKTHIKLANQDLHAQGETFKLLPGMQVIAEINLGDRTVLEYLLSPVEKAVREAGRER